MPIFICSECETSTHGACVLIVNVPDSECADVEQVCNFKVPNSTPRWRRVYGWTNQEDKE